MNRILKLLGFVLSVFILHSINCSSVERKINLAYVMGLEDGFNCEAKVRELQSRKCESEIIRTKYGRYAKGVESYDR